MAETPIFVNRDPDAVLAECKAQLEALLGREVLDASVERLLLNFIVYREVLLLNRFNAAISQLLVKYSTAPVLDYLAELVAVERLEGEYAQCKIKFTLSGGQSGQVFIPAGTRVTDGKIIFETVEERVLEVDDTHCEVEAVAQEIGVAANGIGTGKIKEILDPIAFVSKAENVDVSYGGADVETDESLRERIKLAPNQYSTAGSRFSYEFHAKSASTLVQELIVYTKDNEPGTVRIAVLLEHDSDFPAVQQRILEVCAADTVRPLTDTLIVELAEAIPYNINVKLTLLNNTGVAECVDMARRSLQEFAAKARKMGTDITIAQIIKAATVQGVYDVEVSAPEENIVVKKNQYAQCENINVEWIGFNE